MKGGRKKRHNRKTVEMFYKTDYMEYCQFYDNSSRLGYAILVLAGYQV